MIKTIFFEGKTFIAGNIAGLDHNIGLLYNNW